MDRNITKGYRPQPSNSRANINWQTGTWMETNRQRTQGTEMASRSSPPPTPGRVLHTRHILKIFVDQWQAKQTLESVLAISKAIKKKKKHKAMERHVHFIYARGLVNQDICFLPQQSKHFIS